MYKGLKYTWRFISIRTCSYLSNTCVRKFHFIFYTKVSLKQHFLLKLSKKSTILKNKVTSKISSFFVYYKIKHNSEHQYKRKTNLTKANEPIWFTATKAKFSTHLQTLRSLRGIAFLLMSFHKLLMLSRRILNLKAVYNGHKPRKHHS